MVAETAPRAGWRTFTVLAAALIVAVAFLLVRTKWPLLRPEEARLVGTWYGYIHDKDRHYCWITELRRDRTCRIRFRNFEPAEDETTANAAQERWFYVEDDMRGTWRVDGTTYSTVTSGPVPSYSLTTRLQLWLFDLGSSPGELNYSYTIQRDSPDEFVYTLDVEGVTFHAVRVPDDFAAPHKPVPTTEALAWWEEGSTKNRRRR